MIDKRFRPWLIEVNQSPSFATDSPLDYKIKKSVLQDTFRMLNLSMKKRERIIEEQKKQLEQRILTGKHKKMNPEVRKKLREEMLAKRFAFEDKKKGDWELLYPAPEEKRHQEYTDMLKTANEIWDDFTTGTKKSKATTDDRKNQGSKMSYGKPQQPVGSAAAQRAQQNSQTNLRMAENKRCAAATGNKVSIERESNPAIKNTLKMNPSKMDITVPVLASEQKPMTS